MAHYLFRVVCVMTAAVIELAEYVARRCGIKPVSTANAAISAKPVQDAKTPTVAAPKFDFCFWQGATGARYVHHVYSLIECPQVPAANYLLFGRDEDGSRRLLHAGMVSHAAPSLNLAEIRHRGATLGAREVHVHLLADSDGRRAAIDMDLRAAFGLDSTSGALSG
jgi:hypothetical protein